MSATMSGGTGRLGVFAALGLLFLVGCVLVGCATPLRPVAGTSGIVLPAEFFSEASAAESMRQQLFAAGVEFATLHTQQVVELADRTVVLDLKQCHWRSAGPEARVLIHDAFAQLTSATHSLWLKTDRQCVDFPLPRSTFWVRWQESFAQVPRTAVAAWLELRRNAGAVPTEPLERAHWARSIMGWQMLAGDRVSRWEAGNELMQAFSGLDATQQRDSYWRQRVLFHLGAVAPRIRGDAAAANWAHEHLPEIFDVIALDRPLPSYPRDALQAGVEGYVDVEFTIDEDGDARDVDVLYATDRVFVAEAIEAIKNVRFVPRFENGQTVASRSRDHIEFRLHGDPQ